MINLERIFRRYNLRSLENTNISGLSIMLEEPVTLFSVIKEFVEAH